MKIKDYLKESPMGSPYLKYASNVYSQNGEDGIIKKLLEDLDIKKGTLVEFGAWDGVYLSNVCNLYRAGNFKAILIEGDPAKVSEYKGALENVSLHNFFVKPNREDQNSIDNILKKIGYEDEGEDLVLMSIDIDSSDYYIMESITEYKPIIIVIETNISFPPGSKFKSYDKGCSLDSVWDLGKKMGYSVVAYTSNAILVRNEYLEKLSEFNREITVEEMYIDVNQYLILARLNEEGEILDNFNSESKEYKQKISQ